MSSSSATKLLKVIRLHIVAGGVLAFSLGSLLALANGGSFNPALVVSAYAVMLLGDLSAHYSNDYFDVEVDKYIEQKKFFAGSAILVNHPHLSSTVKSISLSLLVGANLLAILIFLFLGAPIEIFLVILGASLVGWFYSAPPTRLISRGFGEVAVAWVTGFAIPAIGYLAVRGQFDPLFVYLSFPFVMYGFMLSLSLEAPDAAVDRMGGKRTLAVRKGARTIFLIILLLTASATLTFTAYYWLVDSAVLNIGVLALFSIIPLASALVGFAGVLEKKSVSRFSGMNVVSLFVFNMFTVAYLLVIVSAV
ncbi:prenyltransferase [Candidatus Bathyarchaeota archaeon]|nr:prenyltransferase [Candidatus Bathyarchaeota archaeon]